MTVSPFCLTVAALCALGGMTLGIRMGIAQDFTLAPAHAHLNLLGWVTMALYGLWHRTSPRAVGPLAWTQAGCGAAGALLMSGGLGFELLNHDGAFVPVIIAGAFSALTGMALFLLLIQIEARRRPVHAAGAHGQPA